MVGIRGVWIHPWDLVDVGLENVLKELAATGMNSVSLCARYVEERQDWPGPNILFRNPRRLAYTSEENAFYWNVDENRFAELPSELRPKVSREVGPVVKEYVEACKRYGLTCSVWLPILRYERAVRANPELGVVDVSGSPADYKRLFMCPSNPVVRKFVELMVEDLVSKHDFQVLELDYIRFPKPPVTHAPPHTLIPLLACLCSWCRAEMRKHGIDPDELVSKLRSIGEEVRELLNKHPYSPQGDEDYANALFMDFSWRVLGDEVVRRWLAFRSQQISSIVEVVRDKVKEINPRVELSIDLYPPSTSWLMGQDYASLGKLVNSVKIMMYTEPFGISPRRIPFEIELAKKLLPGGVSIVAGLSTWPPSTPSTIRRDIELALEAGADGLYFYSYGWTPKRNFLELGKILRSLRS